MGSPARQVHWTRHVSAFFKNGGRSADAGRYKPIRKRVKGRPAQAVYGHRLERLAVLEKLARCGHIDLFYGDESQVSSTGYVPYGWQFPGEDVCVLAEKGYKINCFGLISRQNQCHWATTTHNITAQFVVEELESLSLRIHKESVVVLDCARIHTGNLARQRLAYWQPRGLFVFFLPPYLPHLNLAETLWRNSRPSGWYPKIIGKKTR